MVCRSLPSRQTSAASRDTSAPHPRAIPTSAAARAGASLTPSPTMATRPCSGPDLPNRRQFVVRQQLALRVDAQLAGQLVSPLLMVAGQYAHVQSHGAQLANRFRRVVSQAFTETKQTSDCAHSSRRTKSCTCPRGIPRRRPAASAGAAVPTVAGTPGYPGTAGRSVRPVDRSTRDPTRLRTSSGYSGRGKLA